MSELLETVETVEARPEFIVDNDMKANWCIEQIKHARADQAKRVDELKRQMEFYKAEIDWINEHADSEVEYFTYMLTRYFNSRVSDGFAKATKTQISYKLPSGKLVKKDQKPSIKVDDGKLLEWMHKNAPEFIKTEETPDWAGLKKISVIKPDKVVTEDGLIVSGVTVTEREPVFFVEVD